LSGATSPPGLAAINKHPYAPLWSVYPGVDDRARGRSPLGDPALDALGRPDDQNGFAPTFRSHFPEHFLTGMQTDHLIRDLSPYVTEIAGVPHGRTTRPPGGARTPRIWVSEHTLLPDLADRAAIARVQPKIVLRSLLAYVGAGAEMVALYSAFDQSFALIAPSFFEASRASGGAYPGDDAGGASMAALRRVAQAVGDGGPAGAIRPVSLRSISDCHGAAQFTGDGTAAHPSLLDRDVLAFFPFQASPAKRVAAYWVMTRDVAKVHRPELPAGDERRFDMPAERFALELGGVRGAKATVTSVDPVSGATSRTRVVARAKTRITVEVEATDSPRLLTISD
jgi:hypothetical protein